MLKRKRQFLGWPAIEEKGVTYLFGQGGYIEVGEGTPVAYILKNEYKLRSPDFSDYQPGIQEIAISWAGFDRMCEHIKVSLTVEKQKSLVSYRRVFGDTEKCA